MALKSFTPNSAGFLELAVSDGMRSMLKQKATRGIEIAAALSEDFRSDRDHPHYADSFEVQETTVETTGQYPGPRAAANIANTSNHAVDVEYGRGNRHDSPATEGHRVLARTLLALGSE